MARGRQTDPSGPSSTAPQLSRAATSPLAWAGGAACLGALILGWVALRTQSAADGHDFGMLEAFRLHNHGHVATLEHTMVHSVDSPKYVVAALILLGLGLRRSGYRLGVAVAVVLLVPIFTAELLKHALPELHRFKISGILLLPHSSWPSGHSTAAMSLALCLVMVAPTRVRFGAALLGTAFATGVGCSTVIGGGHFPSDVIGGFLVAGVWAFLAVAVYGHGRRSGTAGQASIAGSSRPAEWVLGALALLTLGLVPGAFVFGQFSLRLGALAICATALITLGGLALTAAPRSLASSEV